MPNPTLEKPFKEQLNETENKQLEKATQNIDNDFRTKFKKFVNDFDSNEILTNEEKEIVNDARDSLKSKDTPYYYRKKVADNVPDIKLKREFLNGRITDEKEIDKAMKKFIKKNLTDEKMPLFDHLVEGVEEKEGSRKEVSLDMLNNLKKILKDNGIDVDEGKNKKDKENFLLNWIYKQHEKSDSKDILDEEGNIIAKDNRAQNINELDKTGTRKEMSKVVPRTFQRAAEQIKNNYSSSMNNLQKNIDVFTGKIKPKKEAAESKNVKEYLENKEKIKKLKEQYDAITLSEETKEEKSSLKKQIEELQEKNNKLFKTREVFTYLNPLRDLNGEEINYSPNAEKYANNEREIEILKREMRKNNTSKGGSKNTSNYKEKIENLKDENKKLSGLPDVAQFLKSVLAKRKIEKDIKSQLEKLRGENKKVGYNWQEINEIPKEKEEDYIYSFEDAEGNPLLFDEFKKAANIDEEKEKALLETAYNEEFINKNVKQAVKNGTSFENFYTNLLSQIAGDEEYNNPTGLEGLSSILGPQYREKLKESFEQYFDSKNEEGKKISEILFENKTNIEDLISRSIKETNINNKEDLSNLLDNNLDPEKKQEIIDEYIGTVLNILKKDYNFKDESEAQTDTSGKNNVLTNNLVDFLEDKIKEEIQNKNDISVGINKKINNIQSLSESGQKVEDLSLIENLAYYVSKYGTDEVYKKAKKTLVKNEMLKQYNTKMLKNINDSFNLGKQKGDIEEIEELYKNGLKQFENLKALGYSKILEENYPNFMKQLKQLKIYIPFRKHKDREEQKLRNSVSPKTDWLETMLNFGPDEFSDEDFARFKTIARSARVDKNNFGKIYNKLREIYSYRLQQDPKNENLSEEQIEKDATRLARNNMGLKEDSYKDASKLFNIDLTDKGNA